VTAVLVDLGGDGFHVFGTKFPHVAADKFLFLGQFKIHNLLSLYNENG